MTVTTLSGSRGQATSTLGPTQMPGPTKVVSGLAGYNTARPLEKLPEERTAMDKLAPFSNLSAICRNSSSKGSACSKVRAGNFFTKETMPTMLFQHGE